VGILLCLLKSTDRAVKAV